MPRLIIQNKKPVAHATSAKSSNVSSSLSGNMPLIQSQINLKTNNYINIRNAVKILENYSNHEGWIKLYTEVENNFTVDDIVYITNTEELNPTIFNLENPAVAFEDFYTGYKILYTNKYRNEIVINRHFNDITPGTLLKNQYLSKMSCRGGNYFNDVSDGVVYYNCNVGTFGFLSGHVYSGATTGITISGATITIGALGLTSTSDKYGYYSFVVPTGIFSIKCVANGFLTQSITTNIINTESKIIDFHLYVIPPTTTTSTTIPPTTTSTTTDPLATTTTSTTSGPIVISCNNGVSVDGGGLHYPTPYSVSVELGNTIAGIVTVSYNTYVYPDRLIGTINSLQVFDTGYCGDPSKLTELNNALIALSGTPVGSINSSSGFETFYKSLTGETQLHIDIYSPIGTGTKWNLFATCPGGTLPTTTTTTTATPNIQVYYSITQGDPNYQINSITLDSLAILNPAPLVCGIGGNVYASRTISYLSGTTGTLSFECQGVPNTDAYMQVYTTGGYSFNSSYTYSTNPQTITISNFVLNNLSTYYFWFYPKVAVTTTTTTSVDLNAQIFVSTAPNTYKITSVTFNGHEFLTVPVVGGGFVTKSISSSYSSTNGTLIVTCEGDSTNCPNPYIYINDYSNPSQTQNYTGVGTYAFNNVSLTQIATLFVMFEACDMEYFILTDCNNPININYTGPFFINTYAINERVYLSGSPTSIYTVTSKSANQPVSGENITVVKYDPVLYSCPTTTTTTT